MKYQRRDIAEGFVNMVDHQGPKKAIKNLAALILELRLHGQIEEILQDISDEFAHQKGFVEADVKTAFPLSSDLKEQLENYVKDRTNAKLVLLHEELDKSLLAGIILTAPNLELDTSLKTKLTKLKA